MATYISLSETHLSVEPGGEVACDIKVRNTGSVVDLFTFEVLGDEIVNWAEAEPSTVSLMPQQEETIQLHFAPPRAASVPAGPMPFAIKVASSEDPNGSAVEEGTLQIGEFVEIAAELAPRTRRARFSSKYRLALDNFGNAPVNAAVEVGDPDEQLRFRYPAAVAASSGVRSESQMKVRPKRRHWWGPPKVHPFQVTTEAEGAPALASDGQLVQEAIIPKWLVFGLLALAVLAVVWATVLKPTVESAARAGLEEEMQKIEVLVEAAAESADQAAESEKGAEESENELDEGKQKLGTAIAALESEPYDERLETEPAEPGVDGELGPEQVASLPPVEKDLTLFVTDLIFENPNGDSGLLTIQRKNADGETADMVVVSLETIRQHDSHFVSPMVFKEGEELIISVSCRAGQSTNLLDTEAAPKECSNEAVYITGFTREKTEKPHGKAG